ncbi:MAG: 50S ribosomal protein L21 [Solirubrobacterales bacterium]
MYAVIKTGGKQHKVKPGDVIEVEYLHGAEEKLTFHPLLVVDDDGHTHVGKEAERAVVTAKLLGEQKGEKVKVFKYKNKTGYSRRAGHRQLLTLVEIEDVSLGEAAKEAAPKKAAPKKAEPKPAAEEGSAAEPAEPVAEASAEPAAEE